MFDRFSDRARRAIVRAQEEARVLNHNHVGTEHILLGLIAEKQGAASRALSSLNVTLEAARGQVREIVGEGAQEMSGHIPFTPRAKKVVELSLREALGMRSEIIGTEHLLLGLIAEGDGVGAQILERLGTGAQTVRETVVQLATAGPEAEPAGDPVWPALSAAWQTRTAPRIRIVALDEVRDLLKSIDRRLAAIERHLGIADETGTPAPASEDPPAGDNPSAAAE